MEEAIDRLERAVRINELTKLLRALGERPGGAVCCERMEGAREARHLTRMLIRDRIRELKRE